MYSSQGNPGEFQCLSSSCIFQLFTDEVGQALKQLMMLSGLEKDLDMGAELKRICTGICTSVVLCTMSFPVQVTAVHTGKQSDQLCMVWQILEREVLKHLARLSMSYRRKREWTSHKTFTRAANLVAHLLFPQMIQKPSKPNG